MHLLVTWCRFSRGPATALTIPNLSLLMALTVWVSNLGSPGSVTELDASTGAAEQILSGSSYCFDVSYSISSDGTHVRTANYGDSTVTEIDASTGALVKTFKGITYSFDSPMALSSNGADVWVCNEEDQTVTGFPA